MMESENRDLIEESFHNAMYAINRIIDSKLPGFNENDLVAPITKTEELGLLENVPDFLNCCYAELTESGDEILKKLIDRLEKFLVGCKTDDFVYFSLRDAVNNCYDRITIKPSSDIRRSYDLKNEQVEWVDDAPCYEFLSKLEDKNTKGFTLCSLSKKVRFGKLPVRWMKKRRRVKVHIVDFKQCKSFPVSGKTSESEEPTAKEIELRKNKIKMERGFPLMG